MPPETSFGLLLLCEDATAWCKRLKAVQVFNLIVI
jgi:hypothetical protein